MKDFTQIDPERIKLTTNHFIVIEDAFPVSPGHMLIISREVRQDYFELNAAERGDLNEAILQTKELVESRFNPDGYNIGMNCGATAGQTIFHFHCHLIPRYNGDMDNPRGGVRHVIPSKGNY